METSTVFLIMAICLISCVLITIHFYIELKSYEDSTMKLLDDRLAINERLNELIEIFNEMDKMVQITNLEKMELEKEIIKLNTKLEHLEGNAKKDETD